MAVATWLGLALFFFFLLTTSAHQPTGDEEEYVAIAAGIVTNGTPALIVNPTTLETTRPANNTYSKYPLGHSLLLLPVVSLKLILERVLPLEVGFVPHLMLNTFPALQSAAICALLFWLIRLVSKTHEEIGLSAFAAAVLTVATAFGSQLWPASRTLFADNSVAFLFTLTIYLLVRFRAENSSTGWFIGAAWAAALMFLCKSLLILAYPALAAYGTWVVAERQRKNPVAKSQLLKLAVSAALPVVVMIGFQLWYNDLRYGSPWSFGYQQGRDGDFGFSTPILVGLYGITLSSGRSLFLYSPICLVVFFGARKFVQYAKAEAALIFGAALPVVLAFAKWWSWHGGWEWGTRFYLFMIPLLMLVSMPAWRWLDQLDIPRRIRIMKLTAYLTLFALGISIQLLGLAIHPIAYWKMLGSELKVLEYPLYEKNSWEIRDDMPHAHFVPEFSPVAAHAWLVWATFNRRQLNEPELAQHAPWTTLNPKWVPTNVHQYLGYDVWFLGDWIDSWRSRGGPLGAIIFFSGLLTISFILCALKAARLIVNSRGERPQ